MGHSSEYLLTMQNDDGSSIALSLRSRERVATDLPFVLISFHFIAASIEKMVFPYLSLTSGRPWGKDIAEIRIVL